MSGSSDAKPYNDYRTYLVRRYGQPLYRVPVDVGLSCPHRTDRDTADGCAWCGARGARAVHLAEPQSLREQVEAGLRFSRDRYDATEFMAYFQAFTSTNAPAAELRRLYAEVLDTVPFRAVIVATRPDCLATDTIDYLAELTQTYDVCVELGVQTANDATLERLNRGHDFACSEWAARLLASRDIQVAAHVILGLPGETQEDFRQTAARLARLPFQAVKIHNLHVVEGTRLAQMWRQGGVTVWDEHEYAEVLIDFLRRIPAAWPVMRMLCETSDDQLLAPRWAWGKPQFLQYVEQQMRSRRWQQGDLCTLTAAGFDKALAPSSGISDHAPAVAGAEADTATQTIEIERHTVAVPRTWLRRHVRPLVRRLQAVGRRSDDVPLLPPKSSGLAPYCELSRRLAQGDVTLLDLGFGLGVEMLECLEGLPEQAKHRLSIVGLGWDASVLELLKEHYADQRLLFERLALQGSANCPWGKMSVFWGDPRKHLFRFRGHAHVVVFEVRHVERHVEVFTLDFLRRATRFLAQDGIILAPTASNPFRAALRRVGLQVGRCNGRVLRGRGTVAAWSSDLIREPLHSREERLLGRTVSGVPYRDATFIWPRKQILRHHEAVVSRLKRRGWRRGTA